MRRNPDYSRPIAKAVLARMLELLAAGPATTQDLITSCGKSAPRGRDYLMHLRTIGQVYCIAEAVFSFKGSMPAVWALDPEYIEAAPKAADDTVDEFPRRVIVREEYPLHHVRSPMDCLLFGVPAAMERRAA